MGMFKRLAEEASEKVLDFFINLSKRKDVLMSPQQMEKEAGDRARKLAMEAPEVFGYYEDKPIMQALLEASRDQGAVTLTSPKTFRELAAPIIMDHPDIAGRVESTVDDYRRAFTSGQKVPTTAYLDYDIRTGSDGVPYMQITSHDGRHKTRALESLGKPSQFVRMYDNKKTQRIKDLDPKTKVFSEKSMIVNQEPRFVGTLGDLFKILGISAAVAPGALSSLGGENGS